LGALRFHPQHRQSARASDGGYPGGDTAEGQNALFSLTNGGFSTAVGWLSLELNTAGEFNTGLGAGTLALNTANANTAAGTGALLFNTTGSQNTANGVFALFNNTTATNNTATSFEALFIAMLLNEFLKEHRKVEQMQKQIDALTAGLQEVKAQFISARLSDGGLALSKSAPQTALNIQ